MEEKNDDNVSFEETLDERLLRTISSSGYEATYYCPPLSDVEAVYIFERSERGRFFRKSIRVFVGRLIFSPIASTINKDNYFIMETYGKNVGKLKDLAVLIAREYGMRVERHKLPGSSELPELPEGYHYPYSLI